MHAISTCWKSAGAKAGNDIIGPIMDLGVTAIELDYRITEEVFNDMLPALRRGKPAVVSVHNYFPVPAVLTPAEASGDAFLLSSTEREERERAVRYTLRTLQCAHEVGASAVVLHLGKTDIEDDFSGLKEEYEKGTLASERTQAHVREILETRARAGRKHVEAALFSLDRLWKPAERLGITLGVENRYYVREFPNCDDLTIILEKFEGSNIAYWHDVGHAVVQETLYGINHEDLLSRFAATLIGIHLHDAAGTRDHRAPGKGNVDFGFVAKYLLQDAIHVIEVSPDVSAEELEEGIQFLSGNVLPRG